LRLTLARRGWRDAPPSGGRAAGDGRCRCLLRWRSRDQGSARSGHRRTARDLRAPHRGGQKGRHPMSDRLADLLNWMVRDENEHLEFKEAKSQFNFEKLINYCCALANERGGRLVLGVNDKRPRRVVG